MQEFLTKLFSVIIHLPQTDLVPLAIIFLVMIPLVISINADFNRIRVINEEFKTKLESDIARLKKMDKKK